MNAGKPMVLAALMAAWLPALGLSLWLASCQAASAAGPAAPEAAVMGQWVAHYPTLPDILVMMDLKADKKYELATLAPKGVPIQRERGTWLVRASRVVFSPDTCEANQGGSGADYLGLVACTGADSIAVNIAADTWPVTFMANEGDATKILQLTFRRL